jgi:hypothetical protein
VWSINFRIQVVASKAAADDEDDPGDDFTPTAHKLEFPKFDGTQTLYHG